MIQLVNLNERIEDLFALEGIPTRCIYPSPEGPLEVVFPMNREADFFRISRSRYRDIEQVFGPSVKLLPRTILFHLAYEVFGAELNVPIPGQIATNVRNLEQPLPSSRSVINASAQQVPVSVLSYDVDVVLIGPDRALREAVRVWAAIKRRDFNAESRYLRLGMVRVAWTPERRRFPSEEDYIAVS